MSSTVATWKNGQVMEWVESYQIRDSEQRVRSYIHTLVHEWSLILAKLGFTLVPAFFILDYFAMPAELLTRFAAYRLVSTAFVVALYFVIRHTQPSPYSVIHGYLIAASVGGIIALMTTDLGGFNSTYYAGLNLVLTAVAVLLPWEPIHSMLSSCLIIVLYVGLNLCFPSEDAVIGSVLVNNLFFLSGTAIIAVSISYVKQRVVKKEFLARTELRAARDALWGEMEVAKQIQTSLLPKVHRVGCYDVAASMLPAAEVGGDYYDLIETTAGESWVSIGDVSGHGVETGLIMMMTQTSIFSTVNNNAEMVPSKVVAHVNSVIKKNIARLGADRYMTLSVLRLDANRLIVAGKHQDIFVFRHQTRRVDAIPTTGTWIGIVDDLHGMLTDTMIPIDDGDIVLLFTDGITEAADQEGSMFGEERLKRSLEEHADLDVEKLVDSVVRDVQAHMARQDDDITLVALRKVGDVSHG